MSRKPVVPIVLAFVLALGATIFAARWMQQRIDTARMDASATVPVVVVVREIPFGEKITEDMVKVVSWPKDVAPANSFSAVKDALGQFSNLRLFPGDVLLKNRAVDRTAGNELSMLVQADHRAVTVRVNDVIGVAGFLLPGNRVDILSTRKENRDRAETKTLLQNRKVLAVDQTSPSAEKNEPVVVRAVTLELTPEEAEQLASATNEGSIQLALRNPDDVAIIEEKKPAPAPKKQAAVRRAAAAAPPPPETITVIRQANMAETSEK